MEILYIGLSGFITSIGLCLTILARKRKRFFSSCCFGTLEVVDIDTRTDTEENDNNNDTELT